MTLDGIFRKYRGRMRRMLVEARKVIREEKVLVPSRDIKVRLACTPIFVFDANGEGEWRQTFRIYERLTKADKAKLAGFPEDAFEPDNDDLDVTFQIIDSNDSDGTPGGMAFGVDFCTYGGRPSGGLTPYNFTNDVWVPRSEPEKIEERFGLFEKLGGVELGHAAVKAWSESHR